MQIFDTTYPETYLPNRQYNALIDFIAENASENEKRESLKLRVSQKLNLWPEDIRPATDKELEERNSKLQAHLDAIANYPNVIVDPATGIPSNQPDPEDTDEELHQAFDWLLGIQSLSVARDRVNGRTSNEDAELEEILNQLHAI